jgi:hypothetical protein
LKGLLMMGIIMPETCWAASTRQSNKFYVRLLHLVGCFIECLKMHGTTYPKFGSTCFGQCFHPSSGALDCIYSTW